MNYEGYHRLPGVRAGTLKAMAKSPAHYFAACNAPSADNDTLRLGRLVHLLTLEPHRASEVAVWDGGRRGTNAHKAWQAENAGRLEVTEAQWCEAESVAAAVRAHPALVPYLEGAVFEQVLVWDEHGTRCKAMLDWWHPESGTLIDLKTCRDAGERDFSAATARYGYHVQMAHYEAGALAWGFDVRAVVLVAAEKGAPHDVVPYLLGSDVMEVGRRVRLDLMQQVRECERTGLYPGRSAEVVPLVLPGWADPELDEPEIYNSEEV